MIGTVQWSDLPQAVRTVIGFGGVIVAATLGWLSKADNADVQRVEARVDSLARLRDGERDDVSRQLETLLREIRTVKTLVCDLNARDTSCRSAP